MSGAALARNVTRRSVGSQRFLVFLGVQIRSRHRLDPAKMVVNPGDPGNILRCDDRCFPRLLVGDDAAEMNDTVDYNDAESEWSPVGLLYRGDDVVANMIVIGRGIRNIARQS